jgi:hypothetical protein
MVLSIISLTVAAIALFISGATFWFSYLRKAGPHFVCSRWTAIRMQHSSGKPLASFSVYVAVVNKGKIPLEVLDLVLEAEVGEGSPIFYEPILLWDLRQWIEDGSRSDKVGRTQKGQAPLPVVVAADEHFDFGYSILFLPVDKERLVEPLKHSTVELRLHALTDRKKKYVVVSGQTMNEEDIKPLLTKSFSSAISTVSRARRSLLHSSLTGEGQ